MNQQFTNALISGAVSLTVSLITFTLGLKSGKNQSDRQLFKNKYKNISVHFNELLKGLEGSRPKEWKDFKEKKPGGYSIQYSPLMIKMNSNGESIELKQNLIKECEELELELMKYGYDYYKNFDKIKEYIIELLPKHFETIKTKNDYEISTIENQMGIPTRYINYGFIIIKSELEKLLEDIRYNDTYGVCFESTLKYNSGNHWVKIFKNTLKQGNLEELLLDIHYHFTQTDNEIIKLNNDRERLIKKTNQLIKKINRRVREPFTFRETLSGAVLDIFKI